MVHIILEHFFFQNFRYFHKFVYDRFFNSCIVFLTWHYCTNATLFVMESIVNMTVMILIKTRNTTTMMAELNPLPSIEIIIWMVSVEICYS